MPEIELSRADVVGLTEAVAGLDAPAAPKGLLTAIVDAIGEVMGHADQPVTVTVESELSILEQFDGAFTADETVASAAHGVKVRVSKVGK